MKGCVFAGTFDPITIGHMDIIKRAEKLFGKVYLALLNNPNKQTKFSLVDRVKYAKEAVKGLNCIVESFNGLLVDFCKIKDCYIVVRGVRDSVDFAYETLQASVNMELEEQLEVVYFPTKPYLNHISSSMVRELYGCGGDVSKYIPFDLK